MWRDEVFRGDAWTYGIAPNRPTLKALVTYLSDQAMIKEPLPIDDLFVLSHGRYDATPAGPHRLPPVGARRWHIKTSSGRSA